MKRQTAALPLATGFAIACIWWSASHQQAQAASAPQAVDSGEQWERAVAFFKQQSPTASFPEFVIGTCTPSAVFRGYTTVLDYCSTSTGGRIGSQDARTQHAGASVTFHAAHAPTAGSPNKTNELTPAAFEECPYFVYRWKVSSNIAHSMMNFVDTLGLLRWLNAEHGKAGHMEVEPGMRLRPFDEKIKQIFNASFGTTHPPDACFIARTQTSDNHLSSPTLEHANFVRTAVHGACGAPSGADKVVLIHRAGRGPSARNFHNIGEVLTAMLNVFPALEIRKTSSGGLCEQCLMYADARIVVSPHGQQLTNLWCMQQGAVLIELFPWLFFHPLYQFFGSSMGLHVFGSFGKPLAADPGGAAARNGFDTARCTRDSHCRVPMRTQMITANITHLSHVLSVASRLVPAVEQVA